MADRTLTINHADGGSETYTINRDKFAGVRDMSIDGSTVSVDHTAVPKEQNKQTTFGGSQSITVNRDIEPLLSKVVGGAAAAYSLRDLNDSQGNNNVVRVRRESDNSEKDFIAKEVSNGTMARWVNEQPTLPLDLRELDTNTGERDGALIEAAAAYSLRKLKEDFTGDVVEVRRNVDGETEGFTAAEVTDGTMEDFVNASFDDELPLDQATGAAAAYSLRNLSSSYTGNVVEVRRSSDDAVKSFTASEVADGTLEDWVNAVGVARNRTSSAKWNLFTATSTGFDAATSQAGACGFDLVGSSGISVQVSFDVVINSGAFSVQLRNGFESGSSVSNSESINSSGSKSFTLTATSDFVALQFISASADVEITNFSIDVPWTYDGHVKTWYDQSGSDNHAVQTDTANQPKIVDAGDLVRSSNGNPEVDFDGTQSFETISGGVLTNIQDTFTTYVATRRNNSIGLIAYASALPNRLYIAPDLIRVGDPLTDITIGFVNDQQALGTAQGSSGDYTVYKNGAQTGTATIDETGAGDFGFAYEFNSPDARIAEFIIYDTDQSDKRRAIEENIANHYDISLAAYSRDGTVKTWYDQSGSTPANDATQTDPAKQPKIVEGGNLLKDSNNKPEIDFDGTDDYFDLTSNIGFQGGGGCVISLQDPQSGVSTATLGSSSSNRLISFSDASARWYFTTNAIDVDSSTTVSGLTLFTINHDGTTNDPNVKAFRDGSLMVATTPDPHQGEANTSTVANQIGARRDLTYFSGILKELIIYTTDQTDNRTAIEANIGETYGITAIPAANDTVNGFVQTWYDQSGSGNDAVQNAASSQPKIVDGGTLIKRNNNPAVESTSDNYLGFTLDSLSADGQQSVFAVLENDVTSQNGFSAVFRAQSTSSTTGGANRRPWWFVNPTGGLAFTVDSTSGYQNSDRNYRLYSHVMNDDNGGTSTVHRDGTQVDTRAITLDANSTFSDGRIAGVNTNATGSLYMSEVIYYTDDQSSNRPAIETNIANQYGITLS